MAWRLLLPLPNVLPNVPCGELSSNRLKYQSPLGQNDQTFLAALRRTVSRSRTAFRKGSFMKRPAAALLGCIAVLLLIAVAGVATIPTVPTGTWQPMGSMAAARSGAAAVLLQDHRVLIAGGNDASGPLSSA